MKFLQSGVSWLITLLIPFFLLMTAIRILITPCFVEVEYRMPRFPEDPYGFTQADRLYWSRISVDYLLNDQGIEWLGNFHLPDGNPLYNARELSHMLDVKILVQQMSTAHDILLALIPLVGIVAWRKGWLSSYGKALNRGGWLTIGLVATILAAIAVSFNALFTGFHRIFFEGDTWLFQYSDTLIRLFPLRFWQDAFILMGIFTLVSAALIVLLGRKLAQPRR